MRSTAADSVSVLAFGDLHYSSEPPSSRTPTYQAELDAMLDEVLALARRYSVSAVIQAGDHFHRKGRTSHADVSRLMSKYRPIAESFPFLSVAGNHDMIGHNRLSVHESQPLGVVAKSRFVKLIGDEVFRMGSGRMVVNAVGLDYSPNPSPTDIARSINKRVPGVCEGVVVVLHHDIIGPQDRKAYLFEIARVVDVPVLVLNGHIHEPCDAITVGHGTIVNLGSIARTSIAERNNHPSAVLATFSKGKAPRVTVIPLSSALAIEDAFDMTVVNTPTANTDLDTFVELVGGDGEDARFDVRKELHGLASELQIPDDHLAEAVRLVES